MVGFTIDSIHWVSVSKHAIHNWNDKIYVKCIFRISPFFKAWCPGSMQTHVTNTLGLDCGKYMVSHKQPQAEPAGKPLHIKFNETKHTLKAWYCSSIRHHFCSHNTVLHTNDCLWSTLYTHITTCTHNPYTWHIRENSTLSHSNCFEAFLHISTWGCCNHCNDGLWYLMLNVTVTFTIMILKCHCLW